MKKFLPRRILHLVVLWALVAFPLLACNLVPAAVDDPTDASTTAGTAATLVPTVAPAVPREMGQLLQPEEINYLGAFRLPGGSGGSSWEYSGYGLTYYPDGDPAGPDDGFPGSLFAIGHDHQQYVSEINIPVPVQGNLDDLNTATTLQPFAEITGGAFGELEIPRADLAYLPASEGGQNGRLYYAWGQHFEFENAPSHGSSSLDLTDPQPAGPWHLGDYTNHVTNDYLFDIPESWAAGIDSSLRLASGRFRDGTWGGFGPALFAYAPPGVDLPAGATIENVHPLLLYGQPVPGSPELDVSDGHRMNGFHEADEWSGGAWLTAGDRAAVILVGTKALGRSWYGFANGVEYPTSGDPDEVVPDVPPWPYDSRGWWSDDVAGQMIFFSPDDLAAVAGGQLEQWQPQPYAMLDLTPYLYDPGLNLEREKRYLLGAAAFDRDHGLLYLIERRADVDEKSVVHVFQIG